MTNLSNYAFTFHTSYPTCHVRGIMLMYNNLPEAIFQNFLFFLPWWLVWTIICWHSPKWQPRRVFPPFFRNKILIQGLFLWFIAMEVHTSHRTQDCLQIYLWSALKVQWSGFHCVHLHECTVFMVGAKVGRVGLMKFVFRKE